MRPTIGITGALLLASAICLSSSLFKRAEGTTPAGANIAEMARNARFNTGGLNRLVPLADKAKYNLETITRIAELISTFGYHTRPLIEIAEVASETDYECPYFKEIAPLAVMKLSGPGKVVQLARMARKMRTQTDRENLEKAIAFMKAGAELKTYEDALSFNAKQMATFSLQLPPGTQAPAVEKIWRMASENRFHNGALKQIATFAESARYNQEAILKVAELVSTFGYHTQPLIDIAEIASETDFENRYFREIAPLVVMKISGTSEVVALARRAQKAKSKPDQESLAQAIQAMKAGMDIKSYEQALKYNAGMLEKIGL